MEESRLMEVQKIFHLMPEKFKPGRTISSNIYHFVIEEQSWTVFLSAESCVVHEGELSGVADCRLQTSAEIFIGTIKGTFLPTIMDLVQGRIKVSRPDLLLAFKEVFHDAF